MSFSFLFRIIWFENPVLNEIINAVCKSFWNKQFVTKSDDT